MNILKLIRTNNWIKNLTVIVPVFFAGRLLNQSINELTNLILLFLVFCLSSSFIYIINDIKDIEKDRLHPKKSKRPIASGEVSIQKAVIIDVVLLIGACVGLCFLPISSIFCVIAYIIINLLYCFGMKNIAIVDVTSISIGFILRMFAGGIVSNTPITNWIIILVFLLMFSVALAKRRDDLVLSENNNETFRKSQSGYTLQFIDLAKSISFSITIVAYIIYSVSHDVTTRMNSEYVYITSLPVFIGIIRYLQLSIVYKRSGSPVDLLFKDKFLITTIAVWLILFTIILYA